MKFSQSEIQPLWDEVARIIGDGVIQIRHRGEPLSVDALINFLDEQLACSTGIQRRVLLGAAINMLKTDRRS